MSEQAEVMKKPQLTVGSMTEERFDMPIRAAARMVGVHENTIRNWINDGVLPSQPMAGPSGFRRLRRSDVMRLAERAQYVGQTIAETDIIAAQDRVLLAVIDGTPVPEEVLRSLPPWRAVMIAQIAALAGGYPLAKVTVMREEAARVGGAGRLSMPAPAPA